MAGIIQSQIEFCNLLDIAAAQYGKSVTEEAYEASIHGELASVRTGKERLIEAISLGVLTTGEAAEKLEDLREQEGRLLAEVSSIGDKTAIMEEWQKAIEALESQDIPATLYRLAKKEPVAFRRLLGLIFEPNSIQVHTERDKGRNWKGRLVSYRLAEAIQAEKFVTSFVNTHQER
jgi:hypothetical protein